MFALLDFKNQRGRAVWNTVLCSLWKMKSLSEYKVAQWSIYMNDLFLSLYCTSGQGISLPLHMHPGTGLRSKRNQQKTLKKMYDTGWATLCRVPLLSPRKAMLCPSLTLTDTAVRRTAEVCHTALASWGARLAIGLGVWSEPQGYALTVF